VRERLSRNVSVDIAARIGYLVSRFFIPPFVLAHISLAAYGLWSTAFILVSYLGISTLGISNVYVKFVAEYASKGLYDRANRLLSTGLMITVPVCLLLFCGLCWQWPFVANWLHIAPALRSDAHEVVLAVTAIFLASISLSAFRDALNGMQQTARNQSIWIVAYVFETLLIFLLVGLGRGIRGLAEAFLARTALEIILGMVVAFRTLPWLRVSPQLFSKEAAKTLFSFGGIVQAGSLLSILLSSIERAIAAPLLGLEATGLLDIGKKLPAMAASVPSAFASSFMPAASYLQGGLQGTRDEQEAVRKLYLKGARYMNISSGLICGLLTAIPVPILAVWMGKPYPGAALLMAVFAVSTQIHLMTGPGTSILRGIGRPKEEFVYSLSNAVALLLALPLSFAIMHGWTTQGIGIAVALATVISAAVFIRHANRLVGVSFPQYAKAVLLPGYVPYLFGFLLSAPVQFAVAHATRIGGAAWLCCAGIVYCIAVFLAIDRWVWEPKERAWFHSLLEARTTRMRQILPGKRWSPPMKEVPEIH
jgi:O-antigen/teichoic acid export membrane protein